MMELIYGAEKSASPEKNLAIVEGFSSRLGVLPMTSRLQAIQVSYEQSLDASVLPSVRMMHSSQSRALARADHGYKQPQGIRPRARLKGRRLDQRGLITLWPRGRRPLAGLRRMASLRFSQGVVSFNIGLGFIGERQCLRGIEGRRREGFYRQRADAAGSAHASGRNARLQRHVDGRRHCLFVVLKDEGQVIDHPLDRRDQECQRRHGRHGYGHRTASHASAGGMPGR